MLGLIEAELQARGLPWVKLTGQSQKRDEIIQRFTSGEVPLFLISLKAGGVGLNLPQDVCTVQNAAQVVAALESRNAPASASGASIRQ
jgi:hypothetical protein